MFNFNGGDQNPLKKWTFPQGIIGGGIEKPNE